MLFKVEITDGNLLHGWRNYSVKRTYDDVDLIGRFKVLHNAEVEASSCLILSVIDWFVLIVQLIKYSTIV